MLWVQRFSQYIQTLPFGLKLLCTPALLASYILYAFYFAALLLFKPPQDSFSKAYTLGHKGYTKSYTRHRGFVRQLQVGATSTLLVSVLMSMVFGWWASSEPVYAAVCNINTDTTINQAYIDTNTCTDIHITGSSTITFTEAINPGGTSDQIFYIDSGVTATFSGALTLSDTGDALVIDGTLQHQAENTTGVNITAQTVSVNVSGTINVNAKGCAGGASSGGAGNGPGAADGVCAVSTTGFGGGSASGSGSGAGLGGNGGRSSNNTGGATYGTNNSPSVLGSGGGAGGSNIGGVGGGKVRLDVAGTLTVSGNITANGSNGAASTHAGGGGSGGSIHITAGTITGGSSITANGGNGGDGSSGDGGGGGGGRIAVFYNTNSSFTLANITASKGTKGGAQTSAADGTNGTTYILDRKTDDGLGTLTIVSGLDFDSGDFVRTNITAYNGAILSCGTLTTLDLKASSTLDFQGVNWVCSSVDNVNIGAATWSTSNTNVISLNKVGTIVDWDITSDLTLNNLTYIGPGPGTSSASGGVITMDNAISVSLVNSTINSNLQWTGLTNVTIDATSALLSTSKGCAGGITSGSAGSGPDTTTGVCAASTAGFGGGSASGSASGGGHGGAGGRATNNTGGATYGSNTAPILYGSGGGDGTGNDGGRGGGKIRLDLTGTLTLNGAISAYGGNGGAGTQAGGGGSGGSIYLTLATLSGTGTIDADAGNGGDGSSGDGGGGGGGRIAVYYVTDTNSIATNLGASNVALGFKGGTASSAADGVDGTTYSLQYTVADTPSIATPSAGATSQSRSLSVTSSAFSANGGSTHTSSDWQISDDNTFSNDCSDTNIVYCKLASTSNKTSIDITSSNGTFQNALSGKTKLAPNTTYYVRVRYTNIAGNSTWSTSTSFTTQVNVAPATPTNSAPANSATGQSKNPTVSASAFSDADSDAHLNSDWLVYEASDCSGTADWSKTGDTSNLTSIILNSSNGTFADALVGRTTLKAHTTYSFKARYLDTYSGTSAYSSCTSFTSTNTAPALDSSIPTQTILEDNNSIGAFDLDTYFSDVDFNDDDQYTCAASNGLAASLGTITINGNRTVDFTLTSNANGSDTITFTCEDGGGLSTSSNTATVNVTAVNDIPSFTKGASQTVLEDPGAQTVSGWATTISGGPSDESSQTLTFSVTNNNNALFSVQPAVSSSNGNLTFTPTANANGSTTVTLSISDSGGTANSGSDASASQSFTITVTAVNDTPSFTKGADQSVAQNAGVQTVTGWATSISAGPSDESTQSVGFVVSNDNTPLFSTQPAVDTSGTLTYTPDSSVSGSATVSVYAQDSGGTTNSGSDVSATQTFTITTTAVSVPPPSDDTPSEENSAPTFTGKLPVVNMFAGQAVQDVFDLDDYFVDIDGDSLSYTTVVTGAIEAEVHDGTVTVSAPQNFTGVGSMRFTATDPDGATAESSTTYVAVSEALEHNAEGVTRILGTGSGTGTVQVIGENNEVLSEWQAFSTGGVVPRIVANNGNKYIYASKRKGGSVIRVYTLAGKFLKKYKVASDLRWKRWDVGNIDDDPSNQEIVVGTKKDSTVRLKVVSFTPATKTFSIRTTTSYKPVKSKKFSIYIYNKTVTLANTAGKKLFNWLPFED